MANDVAVDVLEITGSTARKAARLCNFTSGSPALLQSHINWLDANVAPVIRSQKNTWVDIYGYASKLGDAQSNQALSVNRCKSVKAKVGTYANQVNFKIEFAKGESESIGGESDDWGYYRAIEIYVFSSQPPPQKFKPVFPNLPLPEAKPKRPKPGSIVAPPGCWCIIGVDTFGIPIKAGVTAGIAAVTLLNDKGEKYLIKGAGVGGGIGVDIAPSDWAKNSGKVIKALVDVLKEMGLKVGDLQNISDDIKKLNLTGPSETTGAVFKRMVWRAGLTINDITKSGYFHIVSGESQIIISGVETGLIFFGDPPSNLFLNAYEYAATGTPWGFFTSMGLGTLKVALGVGGTTYKTTSVQKL